MSNGLGNDYHPTDRHKELVAAYQAKQREAAMLDCPRVAARVMTQAGQRILVAACPGCKNEAGLSAPGKHLCRACGLIFEYTA